MHNKRYRGKACRVIGRLLFFFLFSDLINTISSVYVLRFFLLWFNGCELVDWGGKINCKTLLGTL